MATIRTRVPRFFSSAVVAGPQASLAVLDGRDVVSPNRWKLAPHTVALIGRPAVWTAIDLRVPPIPLGFTTLPERRLQWQQDFGGHLFVAIASADGANVTIVEAGPSNPNGSGGLVPFAYPEDQFAEQGLVDFDPFEVAPPHGLEPAFFADLVRTTQHDYDGDQRYLAIEIPFLRVGRDSNSYAIGVLLACGVDPRAIPRSVKTARHVELTGYPGAEDPVHRANFGYYLGAPTPLADGVVDVAYHNEDGSVRLAVVGGAPNGTARLPDGTVVGLDALGRIAFSPDDAARHGLPSARTEPPEQIRRRRRFPHDPAAAGAEITLVVNGVSTPLQPGDVHRGTISARHDALGIATLRTDTADVVLPLVELGVELRDPRRVDELFCVGNEVTVGLHRDRHPKLDSHGAAAVDDALRPRRFHLPRTADAVLGTAAAVAAVAVVATLWFAAARRRDS